MAPELVGVGWFDSRAVQSASETDPPWTPCHAFVGKVVGVGVDAQALDGQRVVASPDLVCGVCDLCRAGLSAHCRSRTLLGTPGCDGCLQERFMLPARNLTPISDSLDEDRAIFALTLGRALHAAWIVHLEGRPYVTVLGRGATALLAAQVMTKLNASVRIVSSCQATLEAADRFGIRHRPLNDVGRRADQDVVLDVTAPGGGVDIAASMVRPRGRIIVLRPLAAPGYAANDEVGLSPIIENEIEVIGCRGARLREAVTMLERSEVIVDGLISKRFQLEHASDAFLAAGSDDQLRVVVDL